MTKMTAVPEAEISAEPQMDSDGDGVIDNLDVDDDNDGLIEIAIRTELSNIRYNLAGSSYDDEADDGAGNEGAIIGAPTAATARCDTASGASADGNAIFLCGYELANDIDLGGTTSASGDDPPDISCATNEWTPIGGCGSDGTCGETDDPTTPEIETNDDDPFTAILEGNGHTISNLCIEAVIESPTDQFDVLGLFGHLRGATVQNLTIAEIYVENSFNGNQSFSSTDDNRSGALAGYVSGTSAILNVAVTDGDTAIDLQGVETENSQYIGSLVGAMDGGAILASSAAVALAGGAMNADILGGLVGWQAAGSITASSATGAVEGGMAGGLVGEQSGRIIASFAAGMVNGSDGSASRVGGLVGNQRGSSSITASYATGAVSGRGGILDYVGGLVGNQRGSSSITASFATGDADGGAGSADWVGGLVGFKDSDAIITDSYGFGAISGEETAGKDGTAKPSGVTEAAHLAGDSDDATTYAGTAWSAAVWHFGSGSQAPALLYVDGYTFDDGPDNTIGTDDDRHTYSCAVASFPASLMVTCGTTLLPGPAGSPQDR